MAIDWGGLKEAAQAQIERLVREVAQEHPDDPIYGAIFHNFYADGTVLRWPSLAVGTDKTLAEVLLSYGPEFAGQDSATALRWSGADLTLGELAPGNGEDTWAEATLAEANRRGTDSHWDRTYERYERTFAAAAKAARTSLVKHGVVGPEFLAIAMDETMTLVPLSLTPTQLRTQFPDLGTAASPALTTLMEDESLGWNRRQPFHPLLTDEPHGRPTDVLVTLMTEPTAHLHDRSWAARALAVSNRFDLITDAVAAERIPQEVAISGLRHNYSAERDRGPKAPLEYASLEAVLTANPQLERPLIAALALGTGYRTAAKKDLPRAFAALNSPFAVIRHHALWVLTEAKLTAPQHRDFLTRLAALEADPSPLVRRAAAQVYRQTEEGLASPDPC